MAFSDVLFIGAGDYTAAQDRFMTLAHYVEGVSPTPGGDPRTALEVTPNPGGASWQVRVKAGWAFIQGDDVTNQGTYADYNGADLLITNTAQAPASQPRMDIVIVRVNDSEHTVRTPINIMYAEFVYGSPTAGASLANRLGAPTLPPTALHIADVVISPGQSNIQAAHIGDQRRIYGPSVYGEDGKRYRVGVDASGRLGIEAMT
jgi:hypothetical protein